jgi:hypothetical protein
MMAPWAAVLSGEEYVERALVGCVKTDITACDAEGGHAGAAIVNCRGGK